jgi:ketosteroid isomerase-like protein
VLAAPPGPRSSSETTFDQRFCNARNPAASRVRSVGPYREYLALVSSANLELVRSIYAAWERGDFSKTEWADPDIEYVIADGPAAGTWRGLAGMAAAWRDFLKAWEGARARAEQYRELDDERVLVLFRRGGRGKTSGLDLEQIQAR